MRGPSESLVVLDHSPPEACPQCDAPNHDPETGGVFDEETDTCGKPACVVAEKASREALGREGRAADEAEAKWLADLEKMERGGAP